LFIKSSSFLLSLSLITLNSDSTVLPLSLIAYPRSDNNFPELNALGQVFYCAYGFN